MNKLAKKKRLIDIVILITLILVATFLVGREVLNVDDSSKEQKETDILTTKANIDSVDMQSSLAQSKQVKVVVRGILEYDCSTIGTPQIQKSGTVYLIIVEEERPKNIDCSKKDRNFSTAFSLDLADLLPNDYTLDVNGTKTSFEVLDSGAIYSKSNPTKEEGN